MSTFGEYLMCDRKKAYLNKRTANKRAKEWGQYVYECPKCEAYHLTSRPQKDVTNDHSTK